MASTNVEKTPNLKFFTQNKSGLHAFEVERPVSNKGSENPNLLALSDSLCALCSGIQKLRLPQFSPSGNTVCIVGESTVSQPTPGIRLFNTGANNLIGVIPCHDAQHVEFSPLGNFVLTWSRPQKGTVDTIPEGNMKIWKVPLVNDVNRGITIISECSMVASFSQKTWRKDVFQWSWDEVYCFHIVSNEIRLFVGDLSGGVITKVHLKGVTQFKISTTTNPVMISTFNPESGGNPARVSVYKYSGLPYKEIIGPIVCRTTFSATEATMAWNKSGTSLLTHTQSDIDSSNSSYYGSTGLFILSSDGQLSDMVQQSKDGPIHDVKWSPLGDTFVVAAGSMPSQCTLYNARAEPIYEFGSAHRNTISWSPHGRFLCLAGFGNLAGEMDFYDMKKLRKIGSNVAHCTVQHSWSPDSRLFMTAVLAPRMNVDNGFKLFKYNGEGPVIKQDIDQAYDVVWQPVLSNTYPDRGPSPRKMDIISSDSTASLSRSADVSRQTVVPYRPPGSSGALSAMLKRDAAPVGKVKLVNPASNVIPVKRTIPGLPPQPPPPLINSNQSTLKNVKEVKSESRSYLTENLNEAQSVSLSALNSEESKEKKVRNILKKLKAIDEIKRREIDGTTLNSDQFSKLMVEKDLLQQLAELNK